MAPSALPMELPMSQHCHFDASGSLTALKQDSTIIAVIEVQPSVQPASTMRNSISRRISAAFGKRSERARGTLKP
jgi:hypothetical protein